MSWAAPADVPPENPAALRAMLRRRKRQPKLYWLIERPRPRVYARAVVRVVIYRVVAAIAAGLAIALCAFLGAFAGNLSYLRWPVAKSIHDRTVVVAWADALTGLSRWLPAFLMLGFILVIVPRAHLWLFRLVMLTGVALGYYRRLLPPFPQSAATTDLTRRAAALLNPLSTTLKLAPDVQGAFTIVLALLVMAAFVAAFLYHRAYVLTVRTAGFIPHRPVNHNRSIFFSVVLTRRLAAVPITAGLLALGLWIVQSIRAPLPGAHYGIMLLGENESSATFWIAAVVVMALIICTPYPRGYRLLLILLLTAITIYAFWPPAHLLRIPAWMPMAAHGSFWVLVAVFFLAIGVVFDVIVTLLDWPVPLAMFARR